MWVPWTNSRQVVQTLPVAAKVMFHVIGAEETRNIPVVIIQGPAFEKCTTAPQTLCFSGKALNGCEANILRDPYGTH